MIRRALLLSILSVSFVYAGTKVETALSEKWDSASNGWTPTSRTTSTYDEKGNLLNTISQNFTGSYWINTAQNTYSRNQNNSANETLTKIWEPKTESWKNSCRKINSIGESGMPVLITEEVWDPAVSAFCNFQQTSNTYNNSRHLISSLIRSWSQNSWQNKSLVNYLLNPDGTQRQSVSQCWVGNAWTNYAKVTYEYTEAKKITRESYEYWRNGSWTRPYELARSFNEQNQIVHAEKKVLTSGFQKEHFQIDYTSDKQGTLKQSLKQVRKTSDSAWVNNFRVTYSSLHQNSSGLVGNAAALLTIYPNPVSSTLFICDEGHDYDRIQIFSSSGVLIESKKHLAGEAIDIRGLPEGIYIISAVEESLNVKKSATFLKIGK